MTTKIDERTVRPFLAEKLGGGAETAVGLFTDRVRDFLTHLRQTAPNRHNEPTDFESPSINKAFPWKGSFRVTRTIDDKRFELRLLKKGFVCREVKS
jgi:hypothetical protein